MTRMIERWFPCAEVSEHSAKGWGTGFTGEEPVHLVRFPTARAGKSRGDLLAICPGPKTTK